MATKKPKFEMTDDHKAKLAEGRAQGRAIREYLEALEAHKPRPGRKRTPESINKQIDRIEGEIAEADTMKRLHLTQQLMDLQDELETLDANVVDLDTLAKGFVKVAKDYADRKHISYAAWRKMGVPAAVLKQAGISRARQ